MSAPSPARDVLCSLTVTPGPHSDTAHQEHPIHQTIAPDTTRPDHIGKSEDRTRSSIQVQSRFQHRSDIYRSHRHRSPATAHSHVSPAHGPSPPLLARGRSVGVASLAAHSFDCILRPSRSPHPASPSCAPDTSHALLINDHCPLALRSLCADAPLIMSVGRAP